MTPKEQLTDFFWTELEGLELKTGSNQLARIKSLPNGEDELGRLVDILVATSLQAPFDKIPAQTVMRIIQDQMIKDDTFASPPFGQLSGFNQKIVWKWLNTHWQQHSRALEVKASEAPITYEEYLQRCKKYGMEPMSREDFGKPLTDEKIKLYADQVKRNLSAIQEPAKHHQGNALRQKYGSSALPGYYASKQKFDIAGIEIYADSKEQAEAIYRESFGEIPQPQSETGHVE